jgi:glycosyltransferase involved in cell wall biosynthesis
MSKYILIKHHMLNARFMGPGGSHYVMLETAIAFAERKFNVYVDSLILRSRSDLVKLAKIFGVSRLEMEAIEVGDPPRKPSLVINTSGDVFSGLSDVMYIHYPAFIDHHVYYPGLSGLPRFLGHLYSLVNAASLPIIKKRVKLYIANSKFTANLLRECLRIDPIIVNPPVNLDDILDKPVLDYAERDKRVLVVARISPEKHPEYAVYLAYLLKKRRIYTTLVGSFSARNKRLYDYLAELSAKLEVDDYFDITTNAPREKLIELYRTSLAYVHVTPREHFGVSVVEAMATGTPVILPRDSGCWVDIALENSNIALPYSSIKEAAYKVFTLQENLNLWRTLSANGRLRSLELDRRSFRRKLFEVVSGLIK